MKLQLPAGETLRVCIVTKQQDFHATTVQGSVDSEIVIACFDRFCDIINKKTVVNELQNVLDNIGSEYRVTFA